MTVIELSDEQAAALKARAAAQGLSLEAWFKEAGRRVPWAEAQAQKISLWLARQVRPRSVIDENRREMFRGFGEDVP